MGREKDQERRLKTTMAGPRAGGEICIISVMLKMRVA